jgi:hypothetical protein
VKKTTRKIYFSRRKVITCLLLMLLIVAFTGPEYADAQLKRVPTNLRRISGVVSDLSFSKSESGIVTDIYFKVGTEPQTLSYIDSYPSFDRAKRCLVAGASVTVLVSRDPEPELWQLGCDEGRVAGAAEILAARRANGRAAGWATSGSLLVSLLCVWLLVSGRTA